MAMVTRDKKDFSPNNDLPRSARDDSMGAGDEAIRRVAGESIPRNIEGVRPLSNAAMRVVIDLTTQELLSGRGGISSIDLTVRELQSGRCRIQKIACVLAGVGGIIALAFTFPVVALIFGMLLLIFLITIL